MQIRQRLSSWLGFRFYLSYENLILGFVPASGHRNTEDGDDGDAEGEVDENWHILVAQTISKVGNKLQPELQGGRVLKFAAEFCDSSKPEAKGIAFKDSLLLYVSLHIVGRRFLRRELTAAAQTLEDAKLLNAAIVQRMK